MKKILIVFALIFLIGCAKKQVTAPGEPSTMPKEPVRESREDVGKETVKESIQQKEAKLQEDVVSKGMESSIFSDVLFDYDRYNIRDDARPVLDSIASYMKKNGAVTVIIEGHCDERGTNEYNLALGEKRSKAAKDYLASRGVQPSRLTTATYGEEKPVCTDVSEACWQKNRRAHFVVQGK